MWVREMERAQLASSRRALATFIGEPVGALHCRCPHRYDGSYDEQDSAKKAFTAIGYPPPPGVPYE